jgi:beta-exotoxin I transport system permease protein
VNVATVELLHRGEHALRRSAFWWGIGIVAVTVLNVAFWPSLEGTDSLNDLVESSPDLMEAFGVADLSTAAGYLDGQLYALMLPLLLSAMAIAMTSAITSGDEDAGRLELLDALPVSRRAVWLSRFGSAVGVLLAITAMLAFVVVTTRVPFSLDDVSVGRIVAATFAAAALAAFHGTVAYVVGGAGGRRALAVGVSIAVLVAGYVASYLLPLSNTLEDVRRVSPWYWALGTQPVTDGVSIARLGVLVGVTAVLVIVGTLTVERRDIRTP